MTTTWVADHVPSERFPLYSRGNVGEVFPNAITVLTSTLISDAVSRGQFLVMNEMGALGPDEFDGPPPFTGVFGGHLYMNHSVMRVVGIRMPGLSVDDVDEQITGDVAGLPPHRRAPGDRNLLATMRIARYTTTLLRTPDLAALDDARREAQAWLATMPDLSTASDRALLAWLDTYPPRLSASMARLLRSGVVAGIPRGFLDRILEWRKAPPGLANRIVGGTGDVDSARMAHELWRLGRLVASDADLSARFDDGLDDIGQRCRGTALEPAIDRFLQDLGHRGNDEYELATPSWAMEPTPVYAAIDRLRHAPDDRDPSAAAARGAEDARLALDDALAIVPFGLRRLTRRFASLARTGGVARERAKDVLVLENHGARLVLHELARRAAARGGPAEVRRAFCVTASELADFVADPGAFADVIEERHARLQFLAERVPPDWFEGAIAPPEDWPLRAAVHPAPPAPNAVLTGIAVSGGVASGPARVVLDPNEPGDLEPGDVLVCPITDPSWTPLFLGAVAVVCDAGAIQSHAAIIARELGVPAVLSVAGITSIANGTPLTVDGTTGTVTIGP